MTRVLYAQDRRTEQTKRFLVLHADGTLTSGDQQVEEASPRLREKRGWSSERIFEDWASKSNAYVRYFEESE